MRKKDSKIHNKENNERFRGQQKGIHCYNKEKIACFNILR